MTTHALSSGEGSCKYLLLRVLCLEPSACSMEISVSNVHPPRLYVPGLETHTFGRTVITCNGAILPRNVRRPVYEGESMSLLR